MCTICGGWNCATELHHVDPLAIGVDCVWEKGSMALYE